MKKLFYSLMMSLLIAIFTMSTVKAQATDVKAGVATAAMAAWTSATPSGTSISIPVNGYISVLGTYKITGGSVNSGLAVYEASDDGGITYPYSLMGISDTGVSAPTSAQWLTAGGMGLHFGASGYTNIRIRLVIPPTGTGVANFRLVGSGIGDHISAGAYAIQGPQGISSTQAWFITPVQQYTLFNQLSSAVGSSVSITLASSPGKRNAVRKVQAYCDTGATNVLIYDGSNNIYASPFNSVSTTLFTDSWNPGLSGSSGNAMTVTLGSCGGGSVGTLIVQGDRD